MTSGGYLAKPKKADYYQCETQSNHYPISKDAVNGLKIEKDTETKLFKEVTKLDFTHKENNYNDFKREIMLPHMLSTLGPKLAVGDVNKDGIEDVFIGGAKGSAGGIYLQTAQGFY